MSGSDLRVIVIFLALCAGIGFFFFRTELQNLALDLLTPVASEPDPAHVAVYEKLKIKPLTPATAASPPVAAALKDLSDSLCDKIAIFKLSNEIAKLGERRAAANALLGYANACPNSEGELYAAANLLFAIGDYAAVVPIADKLVSQRPEVGQYYYLRAQVLSYLGRHREAAEDVSSAIALFDTLKIVSGGAFELLASAYAADGKPCQAMTAIQTYVYVDMTTRDTAAARKLISDYAAKGKCEAGYADGSEVIPRSSQGVTIVKVSINGVKGNFILDTGASVVTVDTAFADRAKIASKDARKIMAHTANGVAEAKLTTAALVELGKVRAENVSTAIISKPIGNGIDGLLGMSFLARAGSARAGAQRGKQYERQLALRFNRSGVCRGGGAGRCGCRAGWGRAWRR